MSGHDVLNQLNTLWRAVASKEPQRIMVDSAYVPDPWLHIGFDSPGAARRLSARFDRSGTLTEAVISDYNGTSWTPVVSTNDNAAELYRLSQQALALRG